MKTLPEKAELVMRAIWEEPLWISNMMQIFGIGVALLGTNVAVSNYLDTTKQIAHLIIISMLIILSALLIYLTMLIINEYTRRRMRGLALRLCIAMEIEGASVDVFITNSQSSISRIRGLEDRKYDFYEVRVYGHSKQDQIVYAKHDNLRYLNASLACELLQQKIT